MLTTFILLQLLYNIRVKRLTADCLAAENILLLKRHVDTFDFSFIR